MTSKISTENRLWSELLAIKLDKLEAKTAARFKVHVDSIILDMEDGVWPPN